MNRASRRFDEAQDPFGGVPRDRRQGVADVLHRGGPRRRRKWANDPGVRQCLATPAAPGYPIRWATLPPDRPGRRREGDLQRQAYVRGVVGANLPVNR